jgi:hypothetical protein
MKSRKPKSESEQKTSTLRYATMYVNREHQRRAERRRREGR